ncbi:hypothetical protein PBI_PEREGRIN_221 [Rhodococcus phage Peregrin]|nr:hypothetical protein PBI_PEREGRIN_221 [Rhodococcus phage Peregrin]
MKTTNCRWVLRPYAPGQDAVYCEKPVGWRMVRDDDFNLVRKYNTFCDVHTKASNSQGDEE